MARLQLAGTQNVRWTLRAAGWCSESHLSGPVVAEWVQLTGAPSTATVATSTSHVIGICIAGCGISGNAQIAYGGLASCVFDGATTAGDYFVLSSTPGECHDSGTGASSTSFGRVLASSSGTGVVLPVFIALHFQ